MARAVLRIEGLYKDYQQRSWLDKYRRKKSGIPAIDHLSLNLYEGEILGLIGESGSGKTTIGKVITHLCDFQQGQIFFHENNISELSERKFRPWRRKIQIILQDLDAALNPNMKIKQILGEVVQRHQKLPRAKLANYLYRLLKDVNLSGDILEKYPGSLSGGQKRRIAIAAVLAVKPEIIVADEPTTGLDSYTQGKVMQLLVQLQKAKSLSVLLISHDLQLVKQICQRVAVMYLGNIVEIGTTDDIIHSAEHPYTRLLWQSHLSRNIDNTTVVRQHNIRSGLYDYERPSTGCRFAPRCERYRSLGAPKICTEVDHKPPLRRLSKTHEVACHFPTKPHISKPVK